MAAKKKAKRKAKRKAPAKRKAKKSTRKSVAKRTSKKSKPRKRPVKKTRSHRQPQVKHKKVHLWLGVLALILNIFVPGLGSLLGKRVFAGAWQLVLFIVGLSFSSQFPTFGLVVWGLAVIWALVSSIVILKHSYH